MYRTYHLSCIQETVQEIVLSRRIWTPVKLVPAVQILCRIGSTGPFFAAKYVPDLKSTDRPPVLRRQEIMDALKKDSAADDILNFHRIPNDWEISFMTNF